MPLGPSQVNIDERKAAGHAAAVAAGATEAWPYGQTTPENYCYTYWWVYGYNQAVAGG